MHLYLLIKNPVDNYKYNFAILMSDYSCMPCKHILFYTGYWKLMWLVTLLLLFSAFRQYLFSVSMRFKVFAFSYINL